MATRPDYPYQEAILDLENFFKSHIKDDQTLHELLNHLDECKLNNQVDFRYIHERFMKYRKDFSDYSTFSKKEKDMIEDLFYFWG
ncbi:hypothetical protein [Microbulbifer thermotolerans]|uniref:hypothetical protein n=1 Tax=Microbulbifer thermotolerans TaxID=252514 RepID=UPI0022496AA9|nr:hypothetical protein [Microbulbifer thermotolerans]MCX2831880.1 hypothetical protein [Microbulbifer thermotolerans]